LFKSNPVLFKRVRDNKEQEEDFLEENERMRRKMLTTDE